jgi:hypothetical protein
MNRSLRTTLRRAAAAAVLSASSLSAQAFSNRATGLTNPGTTITFDEATTVLGPAANQYAAQGVTFTNLGVSNTNYLGTGNTITNFDGGATAGPVQLLFTMAVRSVAFEYVTNESPTPSIFTAYLDGAVVGHLEAFAMLSNGSNWFGFDNLTLDRVDIQPETGVNQALAIDNLQFTQVTPTPEPATLALFATGLIGVAGFERRRRN